MIKNLLMDLDDTILDFRKAERIALTKTLNSLGIAPDEKSLDRYSEINLWHWKQLELGKMTREEVLFGRFEVFLNECGVNTSPKDAQDSYEHNLGIGHFFMPGGLEAVKRLYCKYDLYIISNGTAVVQYSRLKSADIGKYFKKLFISQEIGYEKPNRLFFEAVFKAVPGMRKEESLVIGDSLTSDIRGGIGCGLKTVWFNARHKSNDTLGTGQGEVHPDFEIDKWEDIDALIESI